MGKIKEVTTRRPSKAVAHSILALNAFLYSILAIAIVIFVLQLTRDKQTYFVYNAKNSEKQIFPLTKPNVNSQTLLRWATTAVTNTYTMDFYNYQSNIDSLKEYYTKSGYINLMASLNTSKRIEDIKDKKLIVTAVLTDTPVILQEGLTRGNYAWRIQMPVLLNYQGASTESFQYDIVVTILVIKVPTNQASKGIGIAQITDEQLGKV